jgi:hypothetical protein
MPGIGSQVTPEGHSALVAQSCPSPSLVGHVALQLDEPVMAPPEMALRMSNVTQHFSLPVQSMASPHASTRPLQAAAVVHTSVPDAASPVTVAVTQHTSLALQRVPPQVSPVDDAPLEEPVEVVPEDDPVAEPEEPPGEPDELEPPFEPPFSLASPPSGRGRTWPPHP